MDFKNTEVALTVNIGGAQALMGRFETNQKVDDQGNKLFEMWKNPYDGSFERIPVIQIKTIALPLNHKCEQHTTLNGDFCAFAVSDEARPKRTISVPYWNKLSPANRLKMGVAKYVLDMFGDVEFTYQILGD